MTDELHFKIIDTFFRENTLVDHHLSSCNNFYEKDIPKIFNDLNPIQYYRYPFNFWNYTPSMGRHWWCKAFGYPNL